MGTKNLEEELKRLQKIREEELKRKSLKTQIWVLKHPKLVSAGEKTRWGLGRLSLGVQAAWKKMKEQEAAQRKASVGRPQESYVKRINKAFS